ncbi:hypothetical protein V1509DRAFT_612592 [Lipomyces kononenkoae]
MFREANTQSTKKTHAGRKAGAQLAEETTTNLWLWLPNPYQLIQSFQENISELELAIRNQRTKATPPKIGKVNPFSGKRGTLKTYLAQMQLYLSNNLGKVMSEADKVLAAATFFEGDAMNWVGLMRPGSIRSCLFSTICQSIPICGSCPAWKENLLTFLIVWLSQTKEWY